MTENTKYEINDASESPDSFRMTDLEESLAGPDGRIVRKNVIDRLSLLIDCIDTTMQRGVAPTQFVSAQLIINSLAAARNLMLRTAH